MTWFLGLDSIVRRVVVIGTLVCLLIVAMLSVSLCSERRRAHTEGAGRTMADARTGAAEDASEVRDRADTRNQQIDDTVKGATDAVRNAPDPASRDDAALRGLCRVNPDAHPRCWLFDAPR